MARRDPLKPFLPQFSFLTMRCSKLGIIKSVNCSACIQREICMAPWHSLHMHPSLLYTLVQLLRPHDRISPLKGCHIKLGNHDMKWTSFWHHESTRIWMSFLAWNCLLTSGILTIKVSSIFLPNLNRSYCLKVPLNANFPTELNFSKSFFITVRI